MGGMGHVIRPSKRHKQYYWRFHDHQGRERAMPGFASKQLTRAMGQNLERLRDAINAGAPIPEDITGWVNDGLDPDRREKLVEWGMVSRARLLSGMLLADHLTSWKESLEAEGRSSQYVGETYERAKAVFDGCGWKSYPEISAERVATQIESMRKRSQTSKRPWGQTTATHYRKSCRAFCSWMFDRGRATSNPLSMLSIEKTPSGRIKRKRRALSPEQIDALIATTGASKRRSQFPAADRALVYELVGKETGFRAGTVIGLRVGDFDLASDPPTVSGRIKGGRAITLPLTLAFADKLRKHFADREPQGRAFACPSVPWMADMLRLDLVEAKIAVELPSGRIDFHALRHSFLTNMGRRGVEIVTLQAYAGHSDIRITRGYLGHRLVQDLAGAKEEPAASHTAPQPGASKTA